MLTNQIEPAVVLIHFKQVRVAAQRVLDGDGVVEDLEVPVGGEASLVVDDHAIGFLVLANQGRSIPCAFARGADNFQFQ